MYKVNDFFVQERIIDSRQEIVNLLYSSTLTLSSIASFTKLPVTAVGIILELSSQKLLTPHLCLAAQRTSMALLAFSSNILSPDSLDQKFIIIYRT